jgi:hypothetical protein
MLPSYLSSKRMATIETLPRVSESETVCGGGAHVRQRSAGRRKRRGWPWSEINISLDALLLDVFVGLCLAAVVVRFAFPRGPAAKAWTR